MGPYDSNPRPPSNPNPNPNSNGGGGGGVAELGDRFSVLGVSEKNNGSGGGGSSSTTGLYQVMKAVEDAESTIRLQMEEKQQLKDQLLWQAQELEKYKLESSSQRPSAKADSVRWVDHNSSMDPQGTVVSYQNGTADIDNPTLHTNIGKQPYFESTKVNGFMKVSSGVQTNVDSSGVSQLSTPSSRSLSPTRRRKEREYDPGINLSGQGLVPVSETSSNNLWKQELATQIREHEEEIALLRKHLADYSLKESQIRNDKYVLEKRIAYMRMAFDQQQQDLVDAASKALSYRQDITEENIRLTYALQAVQQERSTFVSSLLPLLSESNLQPSMLDAQSIVSNLKVLFKHMQEKLVLTEDKLKMSQYAMRLPPQSPPHTIGATLGNSNKNLEIVPRPVYSHVQSPTASPSNAQTNFEWEALGNQHHHTGPVHSGFAAKNADVDGLERMPPTVTRNNVTHNSSAQANQGAPHVAQLTAELKDQNPSFKDVVRGNEIEYPEATVLQHEREATVRWEPGNAQLSSGLDDYPYLPPVLEEPSSSFSEAAEDDPLPAIEGLQISGEAFPGRELQTSGYSINGTTSCNFEWVRYLEDGSVNYIEGAKQPNYLVTADDVDCYLAIEVHPLDERKRKGELVKVFANEQRKINIDPEMHEEMEKALAIGQMSYEVLLSAKYLDIWEQAVLAIKREGYSLKCNGPRGVVVTEKFSQYTVITIPNGNPTEFSIQCANNNEYLLRAKDSSWLRDLIVLTMRLFKKMALEKRKGKKKGLFFK